MTGVSPGETSCSRSDFCRRAEVLVRSSCEWVKWAHRTQAAFLFTSPELHHGQVPGLAWRIDCCLSLLGVTSPGVSSGEPSPPCIAVYSDSGIPPCGPASHRLEGGGEPCRD